MSDRIGVWTSDKNGLPVFRYTGSLPYRATLSNGRAVKLPEDPWFLLGNYRLTLFTHVSGMYEIISGQRSWARINQGEERNSAACRAFIRVDDTEVSLLGMDYYQMQRKNANAFGCGFASYTYELEAVCVKRSLDVKPSIDPYSGAAAFLLTVEITNKSKEAINISYGEAVTANYKEIRHQDIDNRESDVQYTYDSGKEDNIAYISIKARTKDPLYRVSSSETAPVDAFPPILYGMPVYGGTATARAVGCELAMSATCNLSAGQTKLFRWIVGISYDHAIEDIRGDIRDLLDNMVVDGDNLYGRLWRSRIPTFADEEDPELRRELQWHAYMLEAMATYSDYYKETKIPQGTIYDYDWGIHASARDNFQHALPLVYYNRSLAKSVLKYMMKRTTSFGDIRLTEYGFGVSDHGCYFTSDQQLFFFMLMEAYLRVTKDYEFLNETIPPYPVVNVVPLRVMDFIEKCFVFLKDTIGTGCHGLVRLLNSDWNDTVFYINKVPYNSVVMEGESHMNSAMVLAIIPGIIRELRKARRMDIIADPNGRIEALLESMSLYVDQICQAFMEDWGDGAFPARMYFDEQKYGEDNMFLEPQGFTLMAERFPVQRKRILYDEMCKRLYNGEKLGAREQEVPEFDSEEYDKGSRENGGFWWSLNGPVILGLAGFDREEAWKRLKNMTLANMSKQFPDYWSSYWSASDNQESSLIPEEGLPDQSYDYSNIPVICAHPHAWILYCYYYLKDKQ